MPHLPQYDLVLRLSGHGLSGIVRDLRNLQHHMDAMPSLSRRRPVLRLGLSLEFPFHRPDTTSFLHETVAAQRYDHADTQT
jgi:hypothetical protein